jgi:hypothetical protein
VVTAGLASVFGADADGLWVVDAQATSTAETRTRGINLLLTVGTGFSSRR